MRQPFPAKAVNGGCARKQARSYSFFALTRGTGTVYRVSRDPALVRVDIPFDSSGADGRLAVAAARLSPHVADSGIALVGLDGLSVVVPSRSTSTDTADVLASLVPLLRAVGEVASDLGADEVTSYLVEQDSPLKVADVRAVDAAIMSDLCATLLDWSAVQGAYLPLAGTATSMRLLLSRQAFLGTLLAGFHISRGATLDVETLVDLAEEQARPGEWQLMTHAVASAVLSQGYSSVFEDGERLETGLVLTAGTAVNAALVNAHAGLLQVPTEVLLHALATMGTARALAGPANLPG